MNGSSELREMGFDESEIQEALSNGCSSVDQAINFIFACRSSERPPKFITPLRLSKRIESQFKPISSDIDQCASSTSLGEAFTEAKVNNSEPVEAIVRSRYTILQPSVETQQADAKKVADEIRLEKRRKAEDRERVLIQVKEDMQKRSEIQPTAASSSTESQVRAPPGLPPPVASSEPKVDQIQVRLSLSSEWTALDAPSQPVVSMLRLSLTASYGELVDKVCDLIGARCPQGVDLKADERHRDPSQVLRLPCVTFVTNGWPRRRLPAPTDENRNKRLSEIGLIENTTVFIEHVLSACEFKLPENVSMQHENEEEEEEVVPADSDQEIDPLVPQPLVSLSMPPDSRGRTLVSSSSDLSVAQETEIFSPVRRFGRTPGRSGSAALFRVSLQEARRRRLECEAAPSPAPLKFLPCPSLRELCLNRLVSLLVCAIKSSNDSGVSFDELSDGRKTMGSSVLAATFTLRSMAGAWPEVIGAELICRLCEEGCFNARTALLLKNSICRLDLSFYTMATSDLIICLSRHWSDLMDLCLNDLPGHQVSALAIKEISNLKRLQVLKLDGLTCVNDENISSFAALPDLRVLSIARTSVGDAGWRMVASSGIVCHQLHSLNVSGTPKLTDQGLLSLVSVFPTLCVLQIANTNVTGDSEVKNGTLQHLERLNVNGCFQLRCLPLCLIPRPCRQAGRGLKKVSLYACSNLDVDACLEQFIGHQLKDLDGLQKLPQLTRDNLLRFVSMKFPLQRVSLGVLSISDMDVSFLAHLVSQLPADTLRELDLPMRPLNSSDDIKIQIDFLVAGLARLENLVSLDFGRQAVILNPDQLVTACSPMRRLATLCAENLTRDQEASLRGAVSSACVIRVRYYCE